jgi:putative ABC transport system permease protein
MAWWSEVAYFLRRLNRRRAERELDEEVRTHLELETQRNVEAGMEPEEARLAALRTFGSVALAKERAREVWGGRPLEAFWQDFRFGLRVLGRQPGFSAVAMLALALGIGANTAIFSVVNGVLLRPLPFRDPGRIVTVWQRDAQTGNDRERVSPANFLDYRERNRVFEGMAALRPYGLDYTGEGEPETWPAWLVTEGFFEVVGAGALHGRTFLPEEYRPDGANAVVLGHGLWRRKFGADPAVVGRSVVLDGRPHTIVGVMPPEFHFTQERELIAPVVFGEQERARRGATYLGVIARLEPGVSVEQAEADMGAVAARLAEEYPQVNRRMGAAVLPLDEHMVGHVRPALLVLLGAVGFVLLIACANVATLLLARGAARERELAVRAALGAGRARLARQLLTENLALALLGGLLGLLLAWWGVGFVRALNPGDLPRIEQVRLDGEVLGFALAASLLTALAFGLLPAARLSRPDVGGVLGGAGRRAPGLGRRSLGGALVATEIALALVLLAGAGLLVRSFARLTQVDPGFSAENVLTLQVHVYDLNPEPRQQAAYFERALERLRALPGVAAAGAGSAPPFIGEGGIEIDAPFAIDRRPQPGPGEEPTAFHSVTTDGYFAALGIPLLRGRLFTAADHEEGAPVVLINETMARRYWPGEDPVGQTITVRRLGGAVSREIVGVVGDVRHTGLDSVPRAEIFLHHLQAPFGSMTFVVRAASDPLALLPAVKQEIWAVNKNQPFYSVRAMDELVSESLGGRRFSLVLLGSFAAVALSLAGVGVYGLVSFSTRQRTHEIGVRMALGARPGDVLRSVIGEGLLLALPGVVLGLAGAFVLTRFLEGMLFGVAPRDPATFVAISVLLLAVAVLASYLPARRATRIDPMQALRYD